VRRSVRSPGIHVLIAPLLLYQWEEEFLADILGIERRVIHSPLPVSQLFCKNLSNLLRFSRAVSDLTPPLSGRLHIFRRPVGPGLRHSERAWPSESAFILELRPSLSAAALLKESMHG
jgi:hypothetical protein